MKTIWKYELPTQGPVTLTMPNLSEVLSVAQQVDHVALWALVCPDAHAPLVPRQFLVARTGEPASDALTADAHIGTVVLADGNTAHVFEVTP